MSDETLYQIIFLAACLFIGALAGWPKIVTWLRKKKRTKELDKLIDPARRARVAKYTAEARR